MHFLHLERSKSCKTRCFVTLIARNKANPIHSQTQEMRCLYVFFFFFPGEGVLQRTAVLKAICAGFLESTEPTVCLSGG